MSMSLLEQVLKLPKKYSPLVISILLGIIIVGSIGGGLWISNLQNTLANRDGLTNERLNLIEERYRTNFNSLALRVENVETQTLEIHTLLNGLEPQLASASQRLTEISSDSQVPSEHRNTLNELSIDISGMSNTIQSALDKLDTSVENLSPQTQPFEDYGSPYLDPGSSLLPLCFTLFGLIALSIIVFRYLKKHFKLSWQK